MDYVIAYNLEKALTVFYQSRQLESLLKLPKLSAWQKREIKVLEQRISDYVNA